MFAKSGLAMAVEKSPTSHLGLVIHTSASTITGEDAPNCEVFLQLSVHVCIPVLSAL